MNPRKLSEEEMKELQEQFPKLEQNKEERLRNKLEIIVILFYLVMAIIMMYLFYLTFTYQV